MCAGLASLAPLPCPGMVRDRLAAVSRPRPGWRRPPAPLAALLGIVAIVGLCWALAVPPWQSPDEFAHYAYVESLATSLRLPGNPNRGIYSLDQTIAIRESDAANVAFQPQVVPPSWSRADYNAYLQSKDVRTHAMRADGGGPSSASGNPPAYYLFGALGYLLDPGGTAYGRLYAIRLEGVVLLLLTTLGGWLLGGETFARRPLLQLLVAAMTALLPMTTFMSTNVNPDALTITEWTFALWLAARIVTRRASPRDVAAACALVAVAILTKDTSFALLAPELVAIVVGLVRLPAPARFRALPSVAASTLLTAVPVGIWLILSPSIGGTAIAHVATGGRSFNVRQFLSYVWQFYLPRLPFMRPFRLVPGIPAVTVWVNEGTGSFGWLSVPLPAWITKLAEVLVVLLSAVTLGLLSRLRGLRSLGLLAVYAAALVCLLGLLHITEYRQWLGGGGAFLQGRYILPLVSLLALAVGLLVSRLPRSTWAPIVAIILICLIGAQAISLATVVHAYYL